MLFICFFWNCKYIHRLMIARRLQSWWTNRKGQLGSQNKHKLTKHKTRNSNRNKSKALQTKQMLSEKNHKYKSFNTATLKTLHAPQINLPLIQATWSKIDLWQKPEAQTITEWNRNCNHNKTTEKILSHKTIYWVPKPLVISGYETLYRCFWWCTFYPKLALWNACQNRCIWFLINFRSKTM
jgi:hypothetical protein